MSLLNPAAATTIAIPSSSGDTLHYLKVWQAERVAICDCTAAKFGKACSHQKRALDLMPAPFVQEPTFSFDAVSDPQDARRREIAQLREGAAHLRECGEIASAQMAEKAANYFEFCLERDFPTAPVEEWDEPETEWDIEHGPGPFQLKPAPESRPMLHPLAQSLLLESGVRI